MTLGSECGRQRAGVYLVPVVLLIGLMLQAPPARALEYRQGDLRISWGTTLSYGAMFRLADPDPRLIGLANGGSAFSVNGDDGNLNYDTGLISNAGKMTTELEIGFRDFGAFGRLYGFYDYENERGERARRPLTSPALDRVGSRVEIRDAFVWYRFNLGAMPVSLRAGNQVLSWGESTFIQNGINAVNPVDVSALRVPGAELRDALLPVGLVHASLSPTASTAVEAFYQYAWEQTQIDPPGTFFSTTDIAGPGGERVMLGFGFDADDIDPGPTVYSPLGAVVLRGADRQAKDGGQYGLALRWFAAGLNETEFGLYFLNYHSRLPMISARSGTMAGLMDGGNYVGSAEYFLEYPEDIQLFGASFNTLCRWTGIAIQGEVSHRRDLPLQVDDLELLYAAMSPLAAVTAMDGYGPDHPLFAAGQVGMLLAQTNQVGVFGFGEYIAGYRRFDMSQFQATATRMFGRWLGADQIIVLGEGAVSHVHDMPARSELRLEAPGTYTSGNPAHTHIYGEDGQVVQQVVQPATEPASAFPGAWAWGYQVAGRLDYNNVFAGINLAPRFSWQHDVKGISPGPGGNFLEGRRALGLGLGAVYRISWELDISYTHFSGAGRYNLLNDRDFLATTIKYSF